MGEVCTLVLFIAHGKAIISPEGRGSSLASHTPSRKAFLFSEGVWLARLRSVGRDDVLK